jgi:hypothetical protein
MINKDVGLRNFKERGSHMKDLPEKLCQIPKNDQEAYTAACRNDDDKTPLPPMFRGSTLHEREDFYGLDHGWNLSDT